MVTNKAGVGTYRAPGQYEACFFRERLMDMVAADLGLDPVDLRMKNMIRRSEMPSDRGFNRPPGFGRTVYDSGDYPEP